MVPGRTNESEAIGHTSSHHRVDEREHTAGSTARSRERAGARRGVRVESEMGEPSSGGDALDVLGNVDARELFEARIASGNGEPIRRRLRFNEPANRAQPVRSLGVAGAGIVLEVTVVCDDARLHGGSPLRESPIASYSWQIHPTPSQQSPTTSKFDTSAHEPGSFGAASGGSASERRGPATTAAAGSHHRRSPWTTSSRSFAAGGPPKVTSSRLARPATRGRSTASLGSRRRFSSRSDSGCSGS